MPIGIFLCFQAYYLLLPTKKTTKKHNISFLNFDVKMHTYKINFMEIVHSHLQRRSMGRWSSSKFSFASPLPPAQKTVTTIWGAGMARWWEHSPPTNVARVRFPDPASYVGWVCCWFSSLLREFFLRVLRFFLPPQKPTFPNSTRCEIRGSKVYQLKTV